MLIVAGVIKANELAQNGTQESSHLVVFTCIPRKVDSSVYDLYQSKVQGQGLNSH